MTIAFACGALAALVITGRPVVTANPVTPGTVLQSAAPVTALKQPGCLCLKAATALEDIPQRQSR